MRKKNGFIKKKIKKKLDAIIANIKKCWLNYKFHNKNFMR